MKILHIGYSDTFGGASIAMIRLHKSLKNAGIDSNVLVGEKYSNDENIYGPNSNLEKKINEFKIKLARQKKYFYGHNGNYSHSLNLLGSNLLPKIDKIKPDLINLHWINNEFFSIKEISKLKIPTIWTFNDMWPMCGGEHYSSDERYKIGYNNTFKRDDEKGLDVNKFIWNQKNKYWKNKIKHIICISNWLKYKTYKSYLFKNHEVSFIPCTIDPNEWKAISKDAARKKLNLPKDKIILLFLSTNGSKDERKGFIYIKKFLENKIKTQNNIVLLNIGQNSIKEIKDTNLININKSFNGNSEILRIYYSASDILLAPSTLEAFGQVAIEAASCGIPSIGFDNTGLSDAIYHKKTGYLAKYKDQIDFNNGLNWIIKKINEKQNYFSSNCVDFVNQNFSSEIISKKYINIYKRVLKNE